jgi:hypothetical protein
VVRGVAEHEDAQESEHPMSTYLEILRLQSSSGAEEGRCDKQDNVCHLANFRGKVRAYYSGLLLLYFGRSYSPISRLAPEYG